jgi:hypothetical protein
MPCPSPRPGLPLLASCTPGASPELPELNTAQHRRREEKRREEKRRRD